MHAGGMKIIRRTLLILVVVCMAAFIVSGILLTPASRRVKLSDTSTSSVAFGFQCPQGQDFEFVLGIAGVTNVDLLKHPDYAGTLAVKDGQGSVYSCQFNSVQDTNQISNFTWISIQGHIGGYELTFPGKAGQPSLAAVLKPGTSYDVVVDFSSGPPPGSSLWLKWHQNMFGF